MTAREMQVALNAYSMMTVMVIPALRKRGASPTEAVHKYSYVAEYFKRKEFAPLAWQGGERQAVRGHRHS
jgi:hypothetical protein